MNRLERYIANKMLKYRHGRWWMPDRWFVELRYEKCMGKRLNIASPQTVAEKMMWLKLYDHNPLYTILADKYKLKEWFKKRYGEQYIVPNIYTFTCVDEIDRDALPNQFAIKCNHDSGSVFLCYNKNSLLFYDKDGKQYDWEYVVTNLKRALQTNYYYYDREWPYKNIKQRVIMVEPLCRNKNGNLPTDIKLFYGNGEYWFTNVTYWNNESQDRCTYDENWNRLPFVYTNPNLYNENSNTSNVPRPPKYEEMLRIGKEIASLCKFVRVDFYDIDGEAKIGEITFYNGGGLDRFYPDKYDAIYGGKLKL